MKSVEIDYARHLGFDLVNTRACGLYDRNLEGWELIRLLWQLEMLGTCLFNYFDDLSLVFPIKY